MGSVCDGEVRPYRARLKRRKMVLWARNAILWARRIVLQARAKLQARNAMTRSGERCATSLFFPLEHDPQRSN